MTKIVYLIFGLVVGYWLGKTKSDSKALLGDKRIINPDQVADKQRHLEQVLKLAQDKGEIANDDVEKALGVSNATAERYLQELETQGKLQQIGELGKYVKYRAL